METTAYEATEYEATAGERRSFAADSQDSVEPENTGGPNLDSNRFLRFRYMVPKQTGHQKKQVRYTNRYIRTFVPPGKTTIGCLPAPTAIGG